MVKVAVVPVVLMVTSAAGTVMLPPLRKATRIRVSPGSKLVPVRVTGVPPAVGPLLGVRSVVGGQWWWRLVGRRVGRWSGRRG